MSDYKIEIEIYEGKGGQQRCTKGGRLVYSNLVQDGICAWMYRGDGEQSYQAGHVFVFPQDAEKLCPWLLDSLSGFIRELGAGKTLGWRYKSTPYEKVIDPDGITTEFVRCPDPTASGIVVKVIRTKIVD
jgi:hypothetical protein